MDNFRKERIKENAIITCKLEYLGVRFEDTKEYPEKILFYFSVPESSTIEVNDVKLNADIKTADGLKHLAKEMIIEMVAKSTPECDEDFIEYLKNNSSDYLQFFAKVRKGEVWTKELGEQRMQELMEEIRITGGYEVVD